MADVVLVHGSTQGPSGWDRLAASLTTRGHRSIAVDLIENPQHGAEHYLAAALRQVPPDAEAPIVVAHSAAGCLLPGIARALRATHQVWIAAYVPDGRHSLQEEASTATADLFNSEWLGSDPTADPVLATYFLFHDCDLATLRWALTTVRRFSPPQLAQEVISPATGIPSTYVVAARDRTLRPNWCRDQAQARLGAKIVEVDAGHCPHVSHPEDIAAILDRLTVRR